MIGILYLGSLLLHEHDVPLDQPNRSGDYCCVEGPYSTTRTPPPPSLPPSNLLTSCSSFRAAMVAADKACLEVRRAESVLTKAVSLQRALAGQVRTSLKYDSKVRGTCPVILESDVV